MIIKASQRGGATQLGQHLLKTVENEHVEVHQVSGFISSNVMGALKEAQAVAAGTRCKQHLFSLSLNPPQGEDVPPEAFESALAKIEERTGLSGQPRIVVFHEKEGRRHCHAVWSRIKADEMKAVQLSHFKNKLQDISRELYIEHDWKMPEGLTKHGNKDPRNFTLAEWQQAKRIGRNAKDLKESLQEAWSISDSKKSFERALLERGFHLARGDRRGHVAVTHEGDVLSIARMVGQKAKDVKARLGDPKDNPDVEQTRVKIAQQLTPVIERHIRKHTEKAQADMQPLIDERTAITKAHREERQRLNAAQQTRWQAETKARSNRMQKGVRGIWQKVSGKHTQIKRQNEAEAYASHERDKTQKYDLRTAQMHERQKLQSEIQHQRHEQVRQQSKLQKDLASHKRLQERQTVQSNERLQKPLEAIRKFKNGFSLER